MKKAMLCLVLLLLAALCLSGCGADGTHAAPAVQAEPLHAAETAPPTEEAAPPAEEAERETLCLGIGREAMAGMQHEVLAALLREAGFRSVAERPETIEYDPALEGRCAAVTVDGRAEFSADEALDPEAELVIAYYVGATAEAPDDLDRLLGQPYADVRQQFEDAGFTNVVCTARKTAPEEDAVPDGGVTAIAVGAADGGGFAKGTPWYTNTAIRIEYRAEPEAPASETNGGDASGGAGVSVPTQEETEGTLVWVPTRGGTKYHSKSSCSGMIDPMHVSLETALANGYTACKRCH